MRKLVFSSSAKAEIGSIWDYTVAEWGIAKAVEYNQLIETACIGLADGTKSGTTADHIRAGYRLQHVGRHTIYFRVIGTEIEVIRILHQSMAVERHLPDQV